jgi:hypothetical protein
MTLTLQRRRPVAALALAVAGGFACLPQTSAAAPPEPGPTSRPTVTGDGAYDPARVSRKEVGRRCTIVNNRIYDLDETWVVPSHEHGPWYEGGGAFVRIKGQPGIEFSCELPQADMVDTAATQPATLPDPADAAGVREGCGRYLGFDFSGWRIITAAGTDIGTAALLRSTNGYVATCKLDVTDPIPGTDWNDPSVAIHPAKAWKPVPGARDYAVWIDAEEYAGDGQAGSVNLLRAGKVFGPQTPGRIVLIEPDGTKHGVDVVNGWYAIAEDLTLPIGEDGLIDLRIRVLAADGTVLAAYDYGEQRQSRPGAAR